MLASKYDVILVFRYFSLPFFQFVECVTRSILYSVGAVKTALAFFHWFKLRWLKTHALRI